MKPHLPEEIRTRRKFGLGSPVPELFGVLAPIAEDLLSERSLDEKGYFATDRVRSLVGRREELSPWQRAALSDVLGVQLWDEFFVQDRAGDWL